MMSRQGMLRAPSRRSGFTVTELLVVIALIVVLLGLLLPALSGVWRAGEMTTSMGNMRQIAIWMREYSSDHNDAVLPSRFNYRNDPVPGKVRSYPNPKYGSQHAGCWADILWSEFNVGVYPEAAKMQLNEGDHSVSSGNDYRHSAPDRPLYDFLGDDVYDPFRSSAPNTQNVPGMLPTEYPVPYGKGAQELGYRGFFAANNFFTADGVANPGSTIYSNGQIRFPDQAMYLVDSFAGVVIKPNESAYDMTDDNGDGVPDTGEVDFRYHNSQCLMMFLDGHTDPQSQWLTIEDLEGDPNDPERHGRRIRIRNLTRR